MTITNKAFAELSASRVKDARSIFNRTKKSSATYDEWFAAGLRERHLLPPTREGSKLNDAQWSELLRDACGGMGAKERDMLDLNMKEYCSKYSVDKAHWTAEVKPEKYGRLKNARKNALHVWRTAMRSRELNCMTRAQRLQVKAKQQALKKKPTKLLNYRHEVDKMMEWVNDITDVAVNVAKIDQLLRQVREELPEAVNAETDH